MVGNLIFNKVHPPLGRRPGLRVLLARPALGEGVVRAEAQDLAAAEARGLAPGGRCGTLRFPSKFRPASGGPEME